MPRSADVYIHETGKVTNDDRYYEARTAIQNSDSNLTDISFNIYLELTDLDNAESGNSYENRQDFTRYTEDYLHNRGVLDEADTHIVLYNRTVDPDIFSLNGGGFAPYRAEEEKSIAYGLGERKHPSDGLYGLCFVNTSTRKFPYSKLLYKITILHEMGHTMGLAHTDGGIYSSYGGYAATPMSTWYVEDDCGDKYGDPDPPKSLCYNANSTRDACDHYKTWCTTEKLENYMNNNDVGYTF